MPTCWDGVELGDNNNHKDHMAYSVDGTVAGRCPLGFNRRLPQVQLFVRVNNYKGADRRYQLSDGASDFHVDFFNGWQEGKLQEIIDNCIILWRSFARGKKTWKVFTFGLFEKFLSNGREKC